MHAELSPASPPAPRGLQRDAALYRTIWRWHFYAGLLVMPLLLALALSGACYLFKPQFERWEESRFEGGAAGPLVTPHEQVAAARAANPRGLFVAYRPPREPGGVAMVSLRPRGGGSATQVFVSPAGEVRGRLVESQRPMSLAVRIHSELMIRSKGNWLVELAVSWAVVMIFTGLYLWWPRGRGAAGVVWPRFGRGPRVLWRDLHAVTGLWVSALALVLIVTGLPFIGLWGGAFATIKREMGWVTYMPVNTAPRSAAAVATVPISAPAHDPLADLDRVVLAAERADLAFPVSVSPPRQAGSTIWTISAASLVPQDMVTIRYDAAAARETGRLNYTDRHPVDRAVALGMAWHNGQLFGWVSQLVGLVSCLALVLLVVSSFVMWRRRRPRGVLGAPPAFHGEARGRAALAILLVTALFLPMLALSLPFVWLIDKFILPRIPPLARWLGTASPTA